MVRDDLRTLSFTDERTSSFTEFYLVRQQSLKFLVNKRYNVSLHSCQRSEHRIRIKRKSRHPLERNFPQRLLPDLEGRGWPLHQFQRMLSLRQDSRSEPPRWLGARRLRHLSLHPWKWPDKLWNLLRQRASGCHATFGRGPHSRRSSGIIKKKSDILPVIHFRHFARGSVTRSTYQELERIIRDT